MDLQNLSYAVIQLVHNFGALAVAGGAVCGMGPGPKLAGQRKTLSWTVLAGWAAQVASGAAFGGVTWLYYGSFPDIHGVAVAALLVKLACAAAALLLVSAYLIHGSGWSERAQRASWRALTALAATALGAAAFLRWFS